ncbi:MAG: hypothetical protein GY850_35925, partial [bacterium]|nr:hypothetical protein [bacterium]
ADALDAIDIKVSKTTVGKILKNLGFSLKTNIKRISNGGKELTKKERKDGNIQFEYIHEGVKKYKKGIKASEDDLKKLNIKYHEVNPSWNYTLYPN